MATAVLRALAVVAAAIVAATGPQPLIDLAVVVGLGIVGPLALGRPGWWSSAAIGAGVGVRLDPGLAAACLATPAVAAGLRCAADRVLGAPGLAWVRAPRRGRLVPAWPPLDVVAELAAPVWAAVAAASLAASLGGVRLAGIGEPLARLTAVHYLFAGVGATTIAGRLVAGTTGARRTLAATAVVASVVAPPVVALGFVADAAVPQIGGAVVLTVGVWCSALLLLGRLPGRAGGTPGRRYLALLAGSAPWVPMVLAVAWATAQHVAGVPALSIPDMARVHGTVNGVAFVLAGLLATSPGAIGAPAPAPARAARARFSPRA